MDNSKYRRLKTILKFIATNVLPSLVAIAAIAASHQQNKATIKQNAELKAYEITYVQKREAYQNLMKNIDDAFHGALLESKRSALGEVLKIRGDFYGIEPFLEIEDRNRIQTNLKNFEGFCISLIEDVETGKVKDDDLLGKYSDSYVTYRETIRENIFPAIFIKQ